MTAWEYLLALAVSLASMVVMDRRWRLVLWHRRRRAAGVLLAGVAFFLLWDLTAIALGFFERGESAAMTGIELLPELPLEELFFITFLCYLTLVLHALALRLLPAPPARRGARR